FHVTGVQTCALPIYPAIAFCEDLDLWLRMLLSGARVDYHREALALRRIHAANMSNDSHGMITGILTIMERYRGAISLSEEERNRLTKRARRLKAAHHENLARSAITRGTTGEVRNELWRAFCQKKNMRRLAAAMAFTILPGVA